MSVEEPTDDDILNDVLSEGETTDNPVVTEQTEQLEAEPEAETTEATAETTAEKPEVDDNAPQVPSWRLREINEEKRRVADENERLKAELANFRRTQQQPPKEAKEETDDGPDPLLDPKGYAKHVRDEIRNELLNERREDSMKSAHDADPAGFKAAYDASMQAMQSGDVSIKARMQNARDPGKELLKWHKEQKVKAEVGDDLEAYIAKKVEERINAQAHPNAQTQQPNGRPRTSLPPSLNGASRANTTLKAAQDDVSDDEMFRQLTG
jgi:hypothetical protein